MKIETIYVEENDKEYEIWIGENAKENETIIMESSQNDTWFHLQNMSGPHIILKNDGDTIPKRYINKIGAMFQIYKNNLSNKYNIIYTLVKNVKLTDTIGSVNTRNTKVIRY
jgi:predicted ribosome quality control (RQC) complex YloA/Tae2 family protein